MHKEELNRRITSERKKLKTLHEEYFEMERELEKAKDNADLYPMIIQTSLLIAMEHHKREFKRRHDFMQTLQKRLKMKQHEPDLSIDR